MRTFTAMRRMLQQLLDTNPVLDIEPLRQAPNEVSNRLEVRRLLLHEFGGRVSETSFELSVLYAARIMLDRRCMRYSSFMKLRTRITRGGQISIPAAVRRRWATDNVLLEDSGGDELVLRPLPADPISAAIGSLPLPSGLTSERLRARARAEERREAKVHGDSD